MIENASLCRHSLVNSANIANGATESQALFIGNHAMIGIILPAAFTGTTITFKVSDIETGTFVPAYNAANILISVTVAAARAYELPTSLSMWAWIKLVSGSAEGAARVIQLIKKS